MPRKKFWLCVKKACNCFPINDPKLPEQIDALIRKSNMEEVVDERNGKSVTRAELFASFRKGTDEVANGGGISGEEMSKRLRARFWNF